MKKFSTLLMVLAITALLASGLLVPAGAESAVSVWDGAIPASAPAAPFAGAGTEGSPYIIASAADLATFAFQVNNGVSFYKKYVKLVCDIDLSNKPWQPIGGSELSGCYFDGEFDGNHHIIKNLKVETEKAQAGLFGAVGGAVIKNLGVESGSVKGGNFSGGVIGYSFDDAEITNCYNNAEVYSKCLTDNATAGGILGGIVDNKLLSITDCVNNGDISSESDAEHYARAGGIVGLSLGTDKPKELVNCYNTGDVTLVNGKNNLNSRAGGISGGFMNVAKVERCVSTGGVFNMISPADACRIGVIVGSFASHKDGTANMGTFYDCKYVPIAGMNTAAYPAANLLSGATAVDSYTVPRQNTEYGFVYYKTPDDSIPAAIETTEPPVVSTAPVTDATPVVTTGPETAKETAKETDIVTTSPAETTAGTVSSGGCGGAASATAIALSVFAAVSGAALTRRKRVGM